jgi:transglutaminase/protease-like cytokinesis protein 3
MTSAFDMPILMGSRPLLDRLSKFQIYPLTFCMKRNEQVSSLIATYPGDEYRQAESIYLWIKLNIRYDYAKATEFSSSPDSVGPIEIEDVPANRKGVCQDFATLAQQMFEKAGIQCVFIGGHAKQGGDQFFQNADSPLHAWNAVLLGGKWSLVDCTWASISNAFGDSSDYYFITPPDELIYTHYPDDQKWALLSDPPGFEAFKKTPYVTSLFFSLPHGTVPKQGYLTTKSGVVEIPAVLNVDSMIEFMLEDLQWRKGL